MKTVKMVTLLLAVMLLAPIGALASHHYHGCYGKGYSWDMSKLDSDQDRTLSFEEYSQKKVDLMRSGFDKIDTNGDNLIDEAEWDAIREAHGVERVE